MALVGRCLIIAALSVHSFFIIKRYERAMSGKLYEVHAGRWFGEEFQHNKAFDGRRYGVLFEKGVGLATKKQADVLKNNWGYRVQELQFPVESDEKKISPSDSGSGKPHKSNPGNGKAGSITHNRNGKKK
ncbi:MAG: hypothetical protein ACE5I1_30300 [bacterium]